MGSRSTDFDTDATTLGPDRPPLPPPRQEDDDETGFFPADEDGGEESSAPGGASLVPTGAPSLPAPPVPPPDDETRMLETQVVSRDELELLRGAHLRKWRRRIVLRAVLIVLGLVSAAGVYMRLSAVQVKPFLEAPKITHSIHFPEGTLLVTVPNYRDGKADPFQPAYQLWNSALGDDWEVPFTVSFTNWIDSACLREDRETTFRRWRESCGAAFRWVSDFSPPPMFLGGGHGAYPGIRCLQCKYYREDGERENLVGTATFFRYADRCFVLRRELPAEEEGRGWFWIFEIRAALFAPVRLPDKSENTFAALHWEGSPEPDDVENPEAALRDCRKLLDRGDQSAWEDVRRRLSLILRATHRKADPASRELRAGALESLRRLRAAQREFWNRQCLSAVKAAAESSADGKAVKAVRRRTAGWFPSGDDERHWLVRRENWWMPAREGRP